MPDAQSRLSPVEIQAILDWIVASNGGQPYLCPLSKHDLWVVNDYVYQSVLYPIQGNAGTTVPLSAWPAVQIACGGCGYIMYLSAALIGLYPSQGL